MDSLAIDLKDVVQAHERVRGAVNHTPIFTSSRLNDEAKQNLFFKAENMQRTGSFKFRGAVNSIKQLDEEAANRGVITHSSGNHGQALALAAKLFGIKCYVVMPEGSPEIKKKAVAGYGGEIIFCGNDPKEREILAEKIANEKGLALIPSYDHPHIMAGQGTLMLEFQEQVGEPLDYLIVPVGGGGLMSGVSVACKGLSPSTVIIGAEPILAGDAALSLQKGERQPPLSTTSKTVADGLRTGLGKYTFPVLQRNVSEIITVSEKEIKEGMYLVWHYMKLVIEPSAGVGIAVALSEQFKKIAGENKRVGIVLCGGNLDLAIWKW